MLTIPVLPSADAQIRLTVRTSAAHTVQVWGRVTGWQTDPETGAVASVEITDASVFDVAGQRWIGPAPK